MDGLNIFEIACVVIIIVGCVLIYIYTREARITGSSESKIMEWINKKVYSSREMQRIVNAVRNNIRGWEPLGDQETRRLGVIMRRLNQQMRGEKALSPHQLTSLRNMVATDNNINAARRVQELEKAVAVYEQRGLAAACEEHDLPPLMILRNAMRKSGFDSRSITDILTNPTGKWKDDVEYANKHDSENIERYAISLKDSAIFENEVEDYLRSKGIGFKTQAELVAFQTAESGAPTCTPDFLLDTPIKIDVVQNGRKTVREIKWIDAKNYSLPNLSFIVNSVRKQAEKYNSKIGYGAFLFRDGFAEGIYVPGVVFLDWNGREL